jgi:hypothetical protein
MNKVNKAKLFVFVLGIFILCPALFAQQRLQVICAEALPRSLKIAEEYPDSAVLRRALSEGLQGLQAAAYYEASLDSLHRQDSLWTAYLHLGPRYAWQEIKAPPDAPEEWLREAGWPQRGFANKTWSPERLQNLKNGLGEAAARRGYPFSRVFFDSLLSSPGYLSGALRLEKGPLIRLDTLLLRGDVRIDTRYLMRYLGLRAREPLRFHHWCAAK